jgi:hypothetical protein
VTLAPEGGVVELDGGEMAIVYGMIVRKFDPFQGENRQYARRGPFTGRTHLETSSNQFVQRMLATNDYLRLVRTDDKEILDGERALSARLEGISPLTREGERVDLFTRALPDNHLVSLVFITPTSRSAGFEELMGRMLSSVSINDQAIRD